MFGQYDVGAIIQGHFNEVTNRENELYESRIRICKKCPLFTNGPLGYVCDAKKCINTETNEMAYGPGKDITCGCGCRLAAKLRLKNAKCVLNKW